MRTSEVPDAFVPYSSPWWLLDALYGAGDDAQVLGDEDVRGIATTHIRMTVDSAGAVASSPSGLRLPSTRADAFAAEVWLDGEGRLRRMGCTWPARRRIRFGTRRPHWNTTELWDFGTPVNSPPPPNTGEAVDPPAHFRGIAPLEKAGRSAATPLSPGRTRR